MERFDEWARGFLVPLPASSIREYNPKIQYQEKEEEKDFVEDRQQEPTYRIEKGDPIINYLTKFKRTTVQMDGLYQEERLEISYTDCEFDGSDIISLGVARLFRNNKIPKPVKVLVYVYGPYEETYDEPYVEEVPSGKFGEPQKIHTCFKVTETFIYRKRVKWWGCDQDVSNPEDTPTYEDWEINI